MSEQSMTCPRRFELCAHGYAQENKDRWREDGKCSYCGSLNPDLVMKRIHAGDVVLVPTDKNYKVYVENDGGEPFPLGNRDKFYFQHFSDTQKQQFVEMMNRRVLKLATPGHFYRLPFFAVPLEAGS